MTGETDALSPTDVAHRVIEAAEAKAKLSVLQLATLSVLAGAFIAFGALAYTLVVADSTLGAGPTRLIGGITFSTGLILVVVAGAELFTGDALLVAPWLSERISGRALARIWIIAYLGNAVGALAIAMIAVGAGSLDPPSVAATAGQIATAKLALTPLEAVLRGFLCNMLVCAAVWMSFAARRVSGKILAVIPPVAIFVALGFEHSVANMYALPSAMLQGATPLDIAGALQNLLFVTLGNIGGGTLIAAAYWRVYLHQAQQ
jgi:formate/nitrite transporter